MKVKRVIAGLLACSLIFGQTVWAAGEQSGVVEENAAEECVVSEETETAGKEEQTVEELDAEEPAENDSVEEKGGTESDGVKKEEVPEPAEEAKSVETKQVTVHYQGDDRALEIDENVYENMVSVRSSDSDVIIWDGTRSYSTDYDIGGILYRYYIGTSTLSRGSSVLEFLDEDGNVLAKYEVTVVYQETIAYPGVTTVFKPSDAEIPYKEADPAEWEVVSSDASVCTGTLKFPDAGYDGSTVSAAVILNAKNTGTAVITVNNQGNCMYEFQVHVPQNKKPDNIISFKDPMLLYGLKECTVWGENGSCSPDTDGDGYLSKEEMTQFDVISMYRDYGITDLSGLEYAVNVYSVDFNGQTGLENIDALFEMKELEWINLQGTSVSVEDRFRLADFQDINIVKGELLSFYDQKEIFDDPFTFEITEGTPCVREVKEYTTQYLLGIEIGEAELRISSGGSYVDVHVFVDGIPSDQPVGEDSDAVIQSQGGQRILDTNNTLWEIYPEKKKIKENVDQYVAGWVYSGDESADYRNYTDEDGALWSDDKKIADNIVKFTGHYALNGKGVLKDIYGSQGTEITDVQSWVEYRNYVTFNNQEMEPYWDTITFVLKTDGTLWSRDEVGKYEEEEKFEKIRSGVKDIRSTGYLTENGEYYIWSDMSKPVLTDVKNFENMGIGTIPLFYKAADGTSYISVSDKYVSVGKKNLTMMKGGNKGYYYLTDEGDLYKFTGSVNEKIAEDVVDISYDYSDRDHYYMTTDGEYRRLSDGSKGTEDNPIKITITGEYQLYDKGIVDDYELVKNGVILLNHVKKMYLLDTIVYYYALRTDGTLWEVDSIPKQILELNVPVTPGDLDGNGAVNVSDLRMMLRSVCGKITLTQDQILAADVEKDDKNVVDVKDLRKLLRYICGKIEELS